MSPPQTPQAQLVRGATESAAPSPISKTWAQIFPKQVESAEQSLKFVQKLLAVGVSSVVYLRNAFPKEAFAQGKALGKVPISLLKSKNKVKEAGSLAGYVLSAMEAIGQKFLRELHLIIHQDGNLNANSVLEVYTFRCVCCDFIFTYEFYTAIVGSPILRMAAFYLRWELTEKEVVKRQEDRKA